MKLILLSLSILNFIHLFAQIPSNGLKVFYPFNQNSNDESGNSQHGSKSNVSLAKDRFGKDSSAYYFSGNSNSYIEIPVTNLLNNTYTYSLWAKLKTFPANNSVALLLNIGGTGGDNYLGIANNYLSNYHGWFGGGYNTVSPGFDPTDKNFNLDYTWNHIVCVRNSTYVLFYVNGVLGDSIGSSTTKTPSYGSNTKGYIGIRNSMTSAFDGWIDDVAIYDRPLSNKEVLTLYNLQPQTSINTVLLTEKILVFPNASNQNKFNINSSKINLNQSNIQIINTLGQVQNFEISNSNINSVEINHQLSKGFYTIIITDEFSKHHSIKLMVD
ncbi:MAG: LamG-like jellyroll fold domain-containing protein [Bacteroidota bacterium]|nr:LamG-like jellyroll fold domain-containing protein [Bacteroidota bacterium]